MADPTPTPQPNEPERGTPLEPIPIAPDSAAPPPPGPPSPPSPGPGKPGGTLAGHGSILNVVTEEPCPQCGRPMAVDAVVCLKCGYDIKAGQARKTTVGAAVEVPPAPESLVPEFSRAGRLDALALTIIGALLLAGAMFVAGWFAPTGASAGTRAALVGRTALQALMHTGTGIIAVVGAAFLLKNRLGRIDLAAARMFVAVSGFLLITGWRYQLDGAMEVVQWGTELVKWVGAMGLYWLLAMALFWKPPREVNMLAGLHFVLYASTALIIGTDAWLARMSAVEPASRTGPPAVVSPAPAPAPGATGQP